MASPGNEPQALPEPAQHPVLPLLAVKPQTQEHTHRLALGVQSPHLPGEFLIPTFQVDCEVRELCRRVLSTLHNLQAFIEPLLCAWSRRGCWRLAPEYGKDSYLKNMNCYQ